MKSLLCIATIACLAGLSACRPASAANMIGYWAAYGSTTLGSVSNYDIIDVAFATLGGTDNATISFSPTAESSSQLKTDIGTMHSQGHKVVLSIGGANANKLTLANSTDISNFVSSIEGIISTYGFDGIDLDLEQGDLNLNSGDDNFESPTTATVVNLITALGQLRSNYGYGCIFSSAPQTLDVCAYGTYGGGDGDYFPLIYAMSGNNQIVGIQCYNSGSMYTCTGASISEGAPDFFVSCAELVLHSYKFGNGQTWPGLTAREVAVGVPATSSAAASGYLSPAEVLEGIKYLGSGTSYSGRSYTMAGGPYPTIGGVMTWDVDYDQSNGWALSTELDSYLHSVGNVSLSGKYYITSVQSGLAIDCGANTKGTDVQMYSSNETADQTWTISNSGFGLSFISEQSGLALDGGANNTGTHPWVYTANGTVDQQWTIAPSGSGDSITSVQSGLVLDGETNTSGQPIQLWTPNGTADQQWVFHSTGG